MSFSDCRQQFATHIYNLYQEEETMGQLSKFFGLKQRGTTVKTELMAGLTTFMTMALSLIHI